MADMSDWDADELTRWLAAERDDACDQADALFARVASSHWRPLEAPAGLEARIMAAVPTRRPAFDLAAPWWVRLTVAAALLVLGLAPAAVSPGLLFDLASNFVTVLARLTHGVVTSGSAALGVWGVSWTLLTTVGRAAVVVTTAGAAPMFIVANLLVASAAFVGLTRLLAPREDCY